MLTTQEIYNMDIQAILNELAKARKSYNESRIQVTTKNSKKTSEMRKQKKYIARLLTILTQKENASHMSNQAPVATDSN